MTVDFDAQQELVDNYDRMPRLFIPGYDASHAMAAALLLDSVAEDANVLLIGAGGGAELVRFLDAAPDWRFVATDPSAAMLDRARAKASAKQADDRVQFETCDALTAPHGPFDAATAFLALHFVPDDGARVDAYRAIRNRLSSGAPFLLVNGAVRDADFERGLHRYVAHANLMGAEKPWIDEMLTMMRGGAVHFIAPEREVELLCEAGFGEIEQFYQGLWIHGWSAHA